MQVLICILNSESFKNKVKVKKVSIFLVPCVTDKNYHKLSNK